MKKSGDCFYCERHYERLTRDHVIPKCKGGTGLVNNIVLSCTRCNGYKGKYSLVEFKYMLQNNPPEYFEKRQLISIIIKNVDRLLNNDPSVKKTDSLTLKVVGKIEIPKPFKRKPIDHSLPKKSAKKKKVKSVVIFSETLPFHHKEKLKEQNAHALPVYFHDDGCYRLLQLTTPKTSL